jgi:hypothetical protein
MTTSQQHADAADMKYVKEILAAMPRGLTREQFDERCRADVNAGYDDEVAEAMRVYFGDAE